MTLFNPYLEVYEGCICVYWDRLALARQHHLSRWQLALPVMHRSAQGQDVDAITMRRVELMHAVHVPAW